MDALLSSFIFIGVALAIFLVFRRLESRVNPLVKSGMGIHRAPPGLTFRKTRFARFNLSPTAFCFYRRSLSYVVAGDALFLRESFMGIPMRTFKIPLGLMAPAGEGFRILSERFDFYATFGDENENIRKQLNGAE